MENKFNFTSSTLWMLPFYKVPNKEWIRAGLINAFLEDEVTQDRFYECKTIRLLFKIDDYKYRLIEDAMEVIPEIIDQYGYGDDLLVVVLQVPLQFLKDYELIMQGRFTELSSAYKELISDRLDPLLSEGAYKTNGKRLQLMICEKDKMVKNTLLGQVNIDMSNIAQGNIWEKPRIEEEKITMELLNQYR